ncbi:MAG TPA: group 1 truncated hemoglobin [Candidatus Binataceae bacterium]
MAETSGKTLYARLGGYDAIAAVVDELIPRLQGDPRLARYWSSPRSAQSNRRERQMAIDFICASAGGPTFYLGRDMKTGHAGMGITAEDYAAFNRQLAATLEKFKVPAREIGEVIAFVSSLEADIVEKK